MRLLYTASDGGFKWTKEYTNCKEAPPYAILSHTWKEGQEITFKDLKQLHAGKNKGAQSLEGYQKLRFCAQQARQDKLEYFWVDTCCINKSDSSELQEAIASMFRWYQNAKKCYVYLSDVQNNALDSNGASAFKKSKWFTRGWTVQELLAPASVEFFSIHGVRLGDKRILENMIHKITNIPLSALRGLHLSKFSIDERYSWMQNRQTTREEDVAYSLMGILECHIPLMYGEGKDDALERLRRAAILKNNRGCVEVQEERLGEYIRWLSAPDPSTNHEKACKQRQPETGLWLLESTEFAEWKKTTASRLWLYGIPGCGKTILSSTITKAMLQHCGRDLSMVAAYFYFDFTDKQKQDPELMLRSLLCQLLSRSSMVSKRVNTLFSACENGRRPPSLHALLEVIPQVMQPFAHVYLIIDALDECAKQSELMDMLETVVGWKLGNVHLLVTSRQERDIESSLRNYIDEEEVINLQRDVVDRDILRYVRQRLCDDPRLTKWNKDAGIRQEIENTLFHGAHGMFRWAECQLDEIVKCRNRAMLRTCLATLPRTLDQTYNRILCAISEADSAYAMRILQWLTFSARPLCIEEIAEVAAIDVARHPAFDREEVLEDPLEALNICSSLVTISTVQTEGQQGRPKRIIALAHYSVQEFLVSDRIKQGPASQYTMNGPDCHTIMTDSCLKYLLQLQTPLSDEAIQAAALARYSAEYWSSHLGQIGEDKKKLSRLVMRLMSAADSAYRVWIQLYDPDYPWMQPDPRKKLNEMATPVYYAALLGLNALTKQLLVQGAEVNIPGGRCGNALHAASVNGHVQVVRTLLTAGADVHAQSKDNGNPLYAASCEGHEAIVKILLESKANVNAQCGRYGNALQSASAAGHRAIVQLLLDYGADVNMRGGLYNNALNAAAAESHTDIVELLLDYGAEILQHDIQRKSVLHHATNNAYCSLHLVELLLSRGAPMDMTDIDNMTLLHYSVKFSHKSVVELLLDSGMSIDTGIHRNFWSRGMVEHEITYEASITTPEPNISDNATGLTPLHFAALTGNPVMTEFLLERGADPNALSRYNEAPIHLTLRRALHGPTYSDDWTDSHWRAESLEDYLDFEEDAVDMVFAEIDQRRKRVLDALLADPRTSLSIRDCQDELPLHCVEYGRFGSLRTVKKLVSMGSDPFEKNLKQQNALHLASGAGDHDVVSFLLSLDVDLASSDNEGLNALHHAARSGDFDTISLLLEAAVVTDRSLVASQDKLGRNLLHLLFSREFKARVDTVQLLLDAGVDGSAMDTAGSVPLASYFRKHCLTTSVDICQLLIRLEGNATFVNNSGQNLAHLCASTLDCKIQVLETLYDNNVDLSQRDLLGRTVLHCAALSGSITQELLQYLLQVVGIDVNAEDASRRTAYQLAAEMDLEDHHPQLYDRGRWERATRLLLQSGAK